ncbi:MAG: hydrogenase nickel incorporation protein HypB [Firmicutes bacterium]|nr:hydrogenase nickel incorporation protein HypB [Bacillota bacterium]
MRIYNGADFDAQDLNQQEIMEENNAYAAENRKIFRDLSVFTVNMMGAPGSGKTKLLETMLPLLQQRIRVAVIEGDLATAKDARRIAGCGVSVVQINTGGGGHLEAPMVNRVLSGFYLEDIDMLIIENVGSLVSPAAFDLGEDTRMVVMSIAEGADKPSKYPTAFTTSQIAVLNKIDLLNVLEINIDSMQHDIMEINKDIKVFATCCRQGEVQSVDALADYLISLAKEKLRNRD